MLYSVGDLKAYSSSDLIQCTVTEKDQFHYYVDITPNQTGEAPINITWSDFPIPQSPVM